MAAEPAEPAAPPKRKFFPHVHAFRGLAIVLVLAGHSLFVLDLGDEHRLELRAYRWVVTNGTVPFVFISGFLFQHLSSRFAYRAHLVSKVKNLLVPYVIVSIPAFAHAWAFDYGVFEGRSTFTALDVASTVVGAIATGRHMDIPFWYLPMILAIHVLTPAFIWIDRHPRAYLILFALLPLAAFAHRPFDHLDLARNLVYFGPVYGVGMAASRFHDTWLPLVTRFLVPLIALWLGLGAVQLAMGGAGLMTSATAFSVENGIFDLNLFDRLLLNAWALALFSRFSRATTRTFDRIAHYSFGLYFVHMYFIGILFPTALKRMGWPPPAFNVLSGVLVTLAVLASSMAVVAAVKRIAKDKSRYLVGS